MEQIYGARVALSEEHFVRKSRCPLYLYPSICAAGFLLYVIPEPLYDGTINSPLRPHRVTITFASHTVQLVAARTTCAAPLGKHRDARLLSFFRCKSPALVHGRLRSNGVLSRFPHPGPCSHPSVPSAKTFRLRIEVINCKTVTCSVAAT